MKKICFNGCSFTAGEQLLSEQGDSPIYDRLVSLRLGLDRTNIAESGSSNFEIFMRSADALKKDFDIVSVQWSGLNRIWLYPGPDAKWFSNDGRDEFRYNDIYLSRRDKASFQSTLSMMNHDYHNILTLIDYCSILDRLADYHGTTVIYINGLVPWNDDLCRTIDPDNMFKQLSDYTKNLLNFDYRDDCKILEFLTNLQKKFAQLDRSKWVNIFDPFSKFMIDVGPDGIHPGPKSHRIMADKIVDYLKINHKI